MQRGRRLWFIQDVERPLDFLIALGVTAAAAYLFYRSVFGMAVGVFIVPFIMKLLHMQREGKARKELLDGFRNAMEAVSGALNAGYSAEMAWLEAQKELDKLYGSNAEITRAFAFMNKQVQMNEPLEKTLMRFALESGVEEICNFAEIFRYAKRSGGDMTEIIRRTNTQMRETAEAMEDIETAMSSKRMEQRMLMILVPVMLLFVTVSSGQYMESLYHNALGVLIMSGCLAGYLAASVWSWKIVSIEV